MESTESIDSEPGAASPGGAAAADALAQPAALERERAVFRAEREAMVTETIAARGIRNERVLDAMLKVPRHAFVSADQRALAYEDRPLAIAGGQTISQPYIVASMTEAADPGAADRCLEIGTGSGYQAAILAELCGETYSIEYLPEVAAFARRNLYALGYQHKVKLRLGDGYQGWPEAAPFDVILVTAAPERVPPPLLEQLAMRGKLLIPVGSQDEGQELELWTRVAAGNGPSAFERRSLYGVRFVPFLGRDGADEPNPGAAPQPK